MQVNWDFSTFAIKRAGEKTAKGARRNTYITAILKNPSEDQLAEAERYSTMQLVATRAAALGQTPREVLEALLAEAD